MVGMLGGLYNNLYLATPCCGMQLKPVPQKPLCPQSSKIKPKHLIVWCLPFGPGVC